MEHEKVRSLILDVQQKMADLQATVQRLVEADEERGEIVWVADTGKIYHVKQSCKRSGKGGWDPSLKSRYRTELPDDVKPCDSCAK